MDDLQDFIRNNRSKATTLLSHLHGPNLNVEFALFGASVASHSR